MCKLQGAIPSQRVGAGRLGCHGCLVAEGALAAGMGCPWLQPASRRRWGRLLVPLGHVERGNKGLGEEVREQRKKAEEKERFGAEQEGTGDGSQQRRKRSMEAGGGRESRGGGDGKGGR